MFSSEYGMNFFYRCTYRTRILIITFFISINAIASIEINSTRLIYPSDQTAISIGLRNIGTSPVLVQSWLDNGDANIDPATIKVPFILTPPLARIEAGKEFSLRLNYTENILPMHQESVFWFNALEVPAKDSGGKDLLQMAIRTRIKLFFRPVGLAGNANEAASALTWRMTGTHLQVSNSSPYYVSLLRLTINGRQVEGEMVAPHGVLDFNLVAKKGDRLSGIFINDYGITNKFDAVIQ